MSKLFVTLTLASGVFLAGSGYGEWIGGTKGWNPVGDTLSTTARVGIGTTSPGAKLDVVGGAIRTNNQLISTIATGTAPLAVSSTTPVINLNADMVDGRHASNSVYRNSTSVTSTGTGWHRVAHIDGASGRGTQIVTLYTTGGSFAPFYTTVMWSHDWSVGAYITVLHHTSSSYWDQVRVTDDGTNSYLEFNFLSDVTQANIELQAIGYSRGDVYSGALLLGGNTVRQTATLGGFVVGPNYLMVSTGGNVGIGTTSPGYKLDVAGDINTTGEVRKNGTAYNNPDYVFEPGYKLLSLDSLKEFVIEKGHLPNMPSSEEIKKEGVKIFEQNRLILEKLEEAYLYIFAQQEAIKEQQEEIETQQQKVSTLEQAIAKIEANLRYEATDYSDTGCTDF